ncbi:hypothetical protein ACT3CD_11570 [Geofilum sp. OHC36d9]|uniref:hypothetical protein n=1 Tax=Geofilum sp. OHC36d9 TaxID=3458413 RepID=UPI0040342130
MLFNLYFVIGKILSQGEKDSIFIENKCWVFPKYLIGISVLNQNELKRTLEFEMNTQPFLIRADKNNKAAFLALLGGGIFMGVFAREAIVDDNNKWPLFEIGAGFITLSIPFSLKANRQRQTAINIYNNTLPNIIE